MLTWSCKSGYVKSGNSCINPCDNRTAVISSCPANASCSYFSDCSSKIQSWSCNSGYEKSGNSCVASIKVGSIVYGDGTVASGLVASKQPIGVVFDANNRLAVALTDVKQNGSAGSETMYWSNSWCDIPSLLNCTDRRTVIECSTDGKTNTEIILESTCSGPTYAANAVNSYQISGCSKDFCRQGKWVLPSMRDLNTIYSFKSAINSTLTLLSSVGASQVREDDYYWSSTEYNGGTVWGLLMSTGNRYSNGKYSNDSYVRPVVKF